MKYRQIFFDFLFFLTDAVDFYFNVQDLQGEKTKQKMKLIEFFPPTKLSEKERCVNMETSCWLKGREQEIFQPK